MPATSANNSAYSPSKPYPWPGVVRAYAPFLPVNEKTPVVTLLEGNTPLIPAPHLSAVTGLDVYLKFEGANPTGSFKDRGMAMAMTKAVEDGATTVLCASTGNTSASAAAYAVRAGLRCVVILPAGKIALGKLAQALVYGAEVLAIPGNFDRALEIARELTAKYPITLVNSVNPYRIEGQTTAAYEVCDALGGRAPDYLFIPVGNAGNITAYWKGFTRYREAGRVGGTPMMLGFEAEGSAALVRGQPIAEPETIATAIRIGNPASWQGAVGAARDSGGAIGSVTDDEILEAYRLIARHEGVMAEPASAASVAGLLKMAAAGDRRLARGRSEKPVAVCVLTGNGLKDPDIAVAQAGNEPKTVPADVAAIAEAVLGGVNGVHSGAGLSGKAGR